MKFLNPLYQIATHAVVAFGILMGTVPPSFGEETTLITVAYIRMGFHVVGSGSPPPGAAPEYLCAHVLPHWKNIELAWVPESVTVPRAIQQVKQGRADMVLLLSKTPEREKILKYPDVPFTPPRQSGLAVRHENPLSRISSVTDIMDFRIGFHTGAYLSPFMRDKRLNIKSVGHDDFFVANLKMLQLGRLDAVYCPSINVLQYLADDLGIDHRLKFLSLPEPPTFSYSAFSATLPDRMVADYTKAIRKANAILPYEKFMAEYIRKQQ